MFEQLTGILAQIGDFVSLKQPASSLEAYIAQHEPKTTEEVEQLIREYDTEKFLYNRKIALM